MHVHIEDIGAHEGEQVTIKGWLHNRRSSGKIHFLVLRDGTGFLQVVMGKKDVDEATFQKADHLGQESAIVVTGAVQEHPKHPGNYELIASGLDVVSEAHDFPITPKEHGVDYLMDRRHLWIRAERQTAILKVRHEIINAVRDTIEETPPELLADIMENGITLAGGGALLLGLDVRIAEETQMPVHIAEDPLTCVVRGTGIILQDVDTLEKILVPETYQRPLR